MTFFESHHMTFSEGHSSRPLCIELTDTLSPDIDAGILVSEDVLAAMGTCPRLLAKLQILVVAAAVVAGLAGWVPFIHLDEVLALLLQFVFEELSEHTKPIVVGRLAQI